MHERSVIAVKQRLWINIGLLALFTVAIIFGITLIRNVLIDQKNESYTLLVKNYAKQEEERLDSYSALMNLSTSTIADMKAGGATQAEIERFMYTFIKEYNAAYKGLSIRCYGLFNGRYMIDVEGLDSQDLANYDYSKSPWYVQAMTNDGQAAVTDSYTDYFTGRTCVTISQRIKGTDDVLCFDLFFSDRVRSDEQIVMPTGCSYYLFDKHGNVVYINTPKQITDDQAEALYATLMQKAPNGKDSFYLSDINTPVSDDRDAYVQSMDNGWHVVMTVPTTTAMSDLLPFYVIGSALVIVWLVCGVYLTWRDYRNERRREMLLSERDFLVRDREIIEKSTESTLKAYRELFYIDLEKDRMQVVYAENKEERRSATYSTSLERYVSYGGIGAEERKNFLNDFSIEGIRDSLKDSDYFERQFRISRPNGYAETFAISVTAIDRKNGKLVSAAMSIRSVEELIEQEKNQQAILASAAEQAEAANRAKSQFLSRMSHDMRTPLNAIQGMTSLAIMDIDNTEKVQDALTKINSSSKHLLGLINGVLDMSKIESGNLTLTESPFDIRTLMARMQAMFELPAKQHGVKFIVGEKKLDHSAVIGDEERLQQLLVNIIGNAVKFTPKGGQVEVTVDERESASSGRCVFVFTIADTGIGMSEEFIQHLYEPFAREEGASEKIEGTGLGMPIALNIARLMGGDIKVESKVGEGSTFKVVVFLKPDLSAASAVDDSSDMLDEGVDASPVPDADKATISDFKKSDFSGYRVLVVDDVDINCQIACELLRHVGIESEMAHNGDEALRRLMDQEAPRFDLVFMDVQMPILNGYETTRKIREHSKEDSYGYLVDIPVVAMTANAFVDDIKEAHDAGMDGHISKPLDLKQLKTVLQQWLH